jgi:NAD-dependent deacetylase
MDDETAHAIRLARRRIVAAQRIVVLTGAGISTDSGIPDFRGPEGLWTKDPSAEMMSNYDVWCTDPEVRAAAWRSRLDSPLWAAEPNDGHRAIVDLERGGRLALLVTQNIDGLHQAAGSDPSRVVEIHGNTQQAVCLSCGHRQAIEEVLDRVRSGEVDPACLEDVAQGRCGGILKSATISFGQSLVADDLSRSEAAAVTCDLLLAVGSTLAVYPAANVVPLAKGAGADVIIVNGEETAMDSLADVVIQADISSTLRALVDGLPSLA